MESDDKINNNLSHDNSTIFSTTQLYIYLYVYHLFQHNKALRSNKNETFTKTEKY